MTEAAFALRMWMKRFREGQWEMQFDFVDLQIACDREPTMELQYCKKTGTAGG